MDAGPGPELAPREPIVEHRRADGRAAGRLALLVVGIYGGYQLRAAATRTRFARAGRRGAGTALRPAGEPSRPRSDRARRPAGRAGAVAGGGPAVSVDPPVAW